MDINLDDNLKQQIWSCFSCLEFFKDSPNISCSTPNYTASFPDPFWLAPAQFSSRTFPFHTHGLYQTEAVLISHSACRTCPCLPPAPGQLFLVLSGPHRPSILYFITCVVSGWDVAQGQSACLTCSRSWVRSQHPKREQLNPVLFLHKVYLQPPLPPPGGSGWWEHPQFLSFGKMKGNTSDETRETRYVRE